jgi:hypothetical protein
MFSCTISLIETRRLKMTKAKINDRIKSWNVSGMPERGYYIGMVTKVEVDPMEQVEYVYYTAIVQNREGVSKDVWKEMRVPQNGTEGVFETYNLIEVL